MLSLERRRTSLEKLPSILGVGKQLRGPSAAAGQDGGKDGTVCGCEGNRLP